MFFQGKTSLIQFFFCLVVSSGYNLERGGWKMSDIKLLCEKLQSGKGRVEPFIREVCLKSDASAGSSVTEDHSV